MDHLYEKVAYLRGLADGLNIKESSKEGKLLMNIIDTLEEFADAIIDIGEEQEELAEYVEALDEDLMDVEDELFEEEDDDEDEYDDYDDYDEDDDEDIDFAEVECPYCEEEIYVDEDLLEDDEVEVICPQCHRTITIMEEDHYHEHHDGCCQFHGDEDEEEVE